MQEAVRDEPAVVRFRPMQAPSLPLVLAFLAVLTVVVVVVAAWSALISMAFAAAVALWSLPIVDWLQQHGLPRAVAALLVVLVVVAAFIVVILVSVGILVDQGMPFIASAPRTLDDLAARYAALDLPPELRSLLDSGFDAIGSAFGAVDVASIAMGLLQGLVGAVDLVVALTVVPFFMYYVLVDHRNVSRRFHSRVPAPWRTHVDAVVEIFTRDFAQYFRAELLVGSIVGVFVTLGMLGIGAIVGGPIGEFALLLGLTAAVLELLPSIGPVLSFVPALILAAGTSPLAVVLVTVFYLAVSSLESWVLVPLIEGRIVQFDRATVLVLIAVGFALGGMLGAVLALPLSAVARDLFVYFFRVAERESAVTSAEPLGGTSADGSGSAVPEPGA